MKLLIITIILATTAHAGVIQLPATGQEGICFSTTETYKGQPIRVDCAGTGQDGEHGKGVKLPTPRFVEGKQEAVDSAKGFEDYLTGGGS